MRTYRCLNTECGNEFTSRQKNPKFCKRSCYTTIRKKIGDKEVEKLQPVLISDIPSSRARRPSAQHVEAQEPVKEEIVEETVDTAIVQQEDTAEVIHFEDLTINQLQEIISNLLGKVEECETHIEKLIQNDKYDQLRKLVDNFLISLLELGFDDYDLSQLKTPAPVILEEESQLENLSIEKKLLMIRSKNEEPTDLKTKLKNNDVYKPVADKPSVPLPIGGVLLTDTGELIHGPRPVLTPQQIDERDERLALQRLRNDERIPETIPETVTEKAVEASAS